jgi:hypothetical protein
MDYKNYEFIGDSMLMRFQHYKLKRKVQINGKERSIGFCTSGATPQMILDKMTSRTLKHKSAIVMLGTNCLYGMPRETSVEQIKETIAKVLELLKTRGEIKKTI